MSSLVGRKRLEHITIHEIDDARKRLAGRRAFEQNGPKLIISRCFFP
jgi:hypothetical protein